MTTKTYRDFGWQEPKFKNFTRVKFALSERREVEDRYVPEQFTIINYWRGYNGEFGYQMHDAMNPYNDRWEAFENELEEVK